MDVNVDMFSVMMDADAMDQESDDEYDSSWQQSIPPPQTNIPNNPNAGPFPFKTIRFTLIGER